MKNVTQIAAVVSCLFLSACGEEGAVELEVQEQGYSGVGVCFVNYQVKNNTDFRLERLDARAVFDGDYRVDIRAKGVGAMAVKSITGHYSQFVGSRDCKTLTARARLEVSRCEMEENTEGQCKKMVNADLKFADTF